ncbi:MAG TPA: excinuclease ABC subunit UvrB [Candidatus Paceibacterota bacterium]
MPLFKIKSLFAPAGDQPQAIEKLSKGVASNAPHQTLLGVTGSGKTFTVANVIARAQKPTLVISHNKTLAYQLYQEFKEFMPENSVHYFVSYYDYYQPEAYIPQTDTYIDKDVKINEELDRLRHEATQAILSRDNTIVVASVSCIYNIGSPASYEKLSLAVSAGQIIPQKELLKHLVALQYKRNEIEKMPGIFRHKGEIVEVYPPAGNEVIRIIFNKNTVEKILVSADPTRASWREQETTRIFPAKFWLSEQKILPLASANIKNELQKQIAKFKKEGKLLEAQRIEQRTGFDLEMLKSTGYCHGIENYSRHMEFREPDSPPNTLLDYFHHAYGDNFLTVIDESHMTIPQVRGMYHGDRARKETLINYGFRLPSALDNRPLRFHEFTELVLRIIYMSATPTEYELEKSSGRIVEQLVRPTGLLDPKITLRKSGNQVKDAIREIEKRAAKKQRALVTVLTKRMAEDLADYLKEEGIKAHYLHSEVKTLERADTLRSLRLGEYDVIVGVNLLREGLDLPEVSLVIIMDADKEGFLRNKTTLIQTMGRAARHIEGEVIMYANKMTRSMKSAIEETDRRRKIQEEYNKKHNITPQQIEKKIYSSYIGLASVTEAKPMYDEIPLALLAETTNIKKLIADYTKEMKKAAQELDFQKAQRLKDMIAKLKKYQ